MAIFPTGSTKERAVVRHALNRLNSGDDGDRREEPVNVEMKFDEVKT